MATVTETLRGADLYRDRDDQGNLLTKEQLRGMTIEAETVLLGGKQYALSQITYWDSKVFADELDRELAHLNPDIWAIFGKYAITCLDAIRMVNVNSKQGFEGLAASGNQLDSQLFRTREFYDPDNVGQWRTTWVRNIAAARAQRSFFEEDTASEEVTMSEEEAMVWLAWYNPAQTPCADAFQITYNTEAQDIQTFDFEHVHPFKGIEIVEFKEPWTLPPEQSGRVEVNYYRAGTDELRPIGLWIRMSRNLRTL